MDGMMVRQSSVMVVSEPDRGPLSPRPSLLLLLCCGRHAPLLLLRSIGLSMRLRGSVCGGYYEAPLSGCAFVPVLSCPLVGAGVPSWGGWPRVSSGAELPCCGRRVRSRTRGTRTRSATSLRYAGRAVERRRAGGRVLARSLAAVPSQVAGLRRPPARCH